MASTIIAVGKIIEGDVHLRIAPPTIAGWFAAFERGRTLFEQGAPRSACRNQDEEAGWDEAEADLMALPPLQEMIDFAAELEEQIEGRVDEEFWRSGQW